MLSPIRIVTNPASYPVSIAEARSYVPIALDQTDGIVQDLIQSVTADVEQRFLWRAIITQQRARAWHGRVLPDLIRLEPFSEIVSFTQWTPADAAVDVPATLYTTDDAGGTIERLPGDGWPVGERDRAAFLITYAAGWENAAAVPSEIKTAILRRIKAQYDMRVPEDGTITLPPSVASLGRNWSLRGAISG